MIKHAVLYARVSTDEQADKGYSLPSQLELCRKYAERLGFGVVAEFSEDFTGAVAIAERPEGKKLTAMLRTRQADAIIAYCVDRLARDNVELLIAVRMWLRAGIEVHTCDIGRIEDENNIILLIKGWQGSDERKKIAERTSRGRIAKAQSGKVVEHGQALYGYRYGDGCLIIEEEEGRIVRLIFKWYTDGDGDGKPLTLRGIALRLSEVGIPSPRQNNKKIHGPHIWSCQTVGFILTNETYAGTWHYRKWRKRPEERIPVTVPSIIDRGTWQSTGTASIQQANGKTKLQA